MPRPSSRRRCRPSLHVARRGHPGRRLVRRCAGSAPRPLGASGEARRRRPAASAGRARVPRRRGQQRSAPTFARDGVDHGGRPSRAPRRPSRARRRRAPRRGAAARPQLLEQLLELVHDRGHSSKPTTAAPPLIVCAARNISVTSSGSSRPGLELHRPLGERREARARLPLEQAAELVLVTRDGHAAPIRSGTTRRRGRAASPRRRRAAKRPPPAASSVAPAGPPSSPSPAPRRRPAPPGPPAVGHDGEPARARLPVPSSAAVSSTGTTSPRRFITPSTAGGAPGSGSARATHHLADAGQRERVALGADGQQQRPHVPSPVVAVDRGAWRISATRSPRAVAEAEICRAVAEVWRLASVTESIVSTTCCVAAPCCWVVRRTWSADSSRPPSARGRA